MEPPKSHHSRSATAPSHIGPIDHGVRKHRRHSSTGGSRSWTEDEESYLVRTRMNKMPYKHIAAQLHKTELACRLHYHQMSYGSNRRRRADSVSSTASSYTSPSNENTPATGSQASTGSKTPDSQSGSPPPSNYYSPGQTPGQTRIHVPILPKKASTTNLPPVRYATPEEQIATKNLRLDTSFAQAGRHSSDNGLDYGLLRKLYDMHRDSFWTFIASQYSKSPDVTGRKLEEAFFKSTRASTDPLTPPDSPRGTPSRTHRRSFSQGTPEVHRSTSGHSGFCAVNVSSLPSIAEPSSGGERRSASDKCSVSSLLTVEKDVWAPREISTA